MRGFRGGRVYSGSWTMLQGPRGTSSVQGGEREKGAQVASDDHVHARQRGTFTHTTVTRRYGQQKTFSQRGFSGRWGHERRANFKSCMTTTS